MGSFAGTNATEKKTRDRFKMDVFIYFRQQKRGRDRDLGFRCGHCPLQEPERQWGKENKINTHTKKDVKLNSRKSVVTGVLLDQMNASVSFCQGTHTENTLHDGALQFGLLFTSSPCQQ